MNYLAHFHLSADNEGLIVGNFIADFVKGKKYLDYPDKIKTGIVLHREIDSFTDAHATVLKTKERLYPIYHKYASVIVDMYYDHILAANWLQYSNQDLESYTLNIYEILIKNKEYLPENSQYMLKYMMKANWLLSYAKLEGIGKALYGLSRRTKFNSKMEESVKDLEQDYDLIKAEFEVFYPELIHKVATLT